MSNEKILTNIGPTVVGQLRGIKDVRATLSFLIGCLNRHDFAIAMNGMLHVLEKGGIEGVKDVIYISDTAEIDIIRLEKNSQEEVTFNQALKDRTITTVSEIDKSYWVTGKLLVNNASRLDNQTKKEEPKSLDLYTGNESSKRRRNSGENSERKERIENQKQVAMNLGRKVVGAPSDQRRPELLAAPVNITNSDKFSRMKATLNKKRGLPSESNAETQNKDKNESQVMSVTAVTGTDEAKTASLLAENQEMINVSMVSVKQNEKAYAEVRTVNERKRAHRLAEEEKLRIQREKEITTPKEGEETHNRENSSSILGQERGESNVTKAPFQPNSIVKPRGRPPMKRRDTFVATTDDIEKLHQEIKPQEE